jgi:hypothetical protein
MRKFWIGIILLALLAGCSNGANGGEIKKDQNAGWWLDHG